MTLLDERISPDVVERPSWRPGRSRPPAQTTRGDDRPIGLWPRRFWFGVLALLAAWSWRDALFTGGDLVNPGGWTLIGDFFGVAFRPELDGAFLTDVVVPAVGTTVGYALVGTALALGLGLVGGVLSSQVLWQRDPLAPAGGALRAHGGRWAVKLSATLARGVHEAVWALLLLFVLGRNPWVAVLAIGVPFGAVTAKVVAEMLDDADQEPVRALRASGASRVTALVYGLGPTVLPDVVSYGFYRFECALRSSVILGMIGAGGIGFELTQSFHSLRYQEIWTLIYTICLLALLVEWWSTSLRSRPSRRYVGASLAGAAVATAVAVVMLGLNAGTLVDARARRLFGDFISDAWPPRLPLDGWSKLLDCLVDTVQMSVVAITIAAAVAGPMAFVAARAPDANRSRRLVSSATRGALLLVRAIPPTVWAFVVLFVVYPGPLPGGIALGLYTAGVLGRLNADVVTNSDPRASETLRSAGASPTGAFAYGTMPVVAPRFMSLAFYRWEVVLRETVVVGLVGAGGLGRLLAEQNTALDESRMLTTILTLVVAAFAVDTLSGRVRSVLR